jgi:hypothetical protein
MRQGIRSLPSAPIARETPCTRDGFPLRDAFLLQGCFLYFPVKYRRETGAGAQPDAGDLRRKPRDDKGKRARPVPFGLAPNCRP